MDITNISSSTDIFFLLTLFVGFLDMITTIIGIEILGLNEMNPALEYLLKSKNKISKVSYITLWHYKIILLLCLYVMSIWIHEIFIVLVSGLFWFWLLASLWNIRQIWIECRVIKYMKSEYPVLMKLCEELKEEGQ